MKKNILFIVDGYYPYLGGAEVLFQMLAENLAKDKYNVCVLTSKLPEFKNKEVVNNVNIIRIKSPFNSRALFAIKVIPYAIKIAKNFDLIQTTTYYSALPAFLAAKIRKKPVILTVHEIMGRMWRRLSRTSRISSFILFFVEQIIINLPFDRMLTVSRASQNALRLYGVSDFRIRCVYSFVDKNIFDPKKYNKYIKKVRAKHKLEKNIIIFSFGRPGISKGHEYLIKAFPKIKSKILNAKLLLYTPSNPRLGLKNLKSLTKKLHIKEDVIFSLDQPKEELIKAICAADIVVIPSVTEGFGLSTVESCYLKKKVVVSGIGSLPEVVSGKYRLCEPANPNDIAKKVIEVYKGNYVTSPIKYYLAKETYKGYLENYKEILNKNSKK